MALLVVTVALVVGAAPHLGATRSAVRLLAPTRPAVTPADPALAAAMSSMPLSFVENRGQLPAPVAYYLPGTAASIYFTPGGVTYALSEPNPTDGPAPSTSGRWAVKLDFVGASAVTPVATDPAPGVVSYSSASQASISASTSGGVAYRDLWPGIDMVWSGAGSKLEYTFVVHPGADPSRIGLAYSGASDVTLADGRVKVTTPVGSFADDKPFTYQDVDGQRVEVPSRFALTPGAEAGQAGFSIPVGAYDATRDLIIDPVVLIYSTFLGGSGADVGGDIAANDDGTAVVVGFTYSLDFPVTAGPAPSPATVSDINYDAYVAKFNAAGNGLVFARILAGSGRDGASGVAVDAAGNAYVSGGTSSPDFPVVGGLAPPVSPSGEHGFVAKLDPAGDIIYSGRIAPLSTSSIAVDGVGAAYVTGSVQGEVVPVSPAGSTLTTSAGSGTNVYVTKLAPDGASLVYFGYLGGSATDSGHDIAVDGGGRAYVTGNTQSADFPTAVGPDLTLNAGSGGAADAFVARVNVGGTGLEYSGYIGGSGDENGRGIAVDGSESAYVTGSTASTEASFPVNVGPDLTFNNGPGNSDAFVVKVDPAGTGFDYAGYIGGFEGESGHGIAVDANGAAYVTGRTTSLPSSFPVTPGLGLVTKFKGIWDGFVAKVEPTGASLDFAGYLGGKAEDSASAIDVDTAGNIYVQGTTRGGNFPTTRRTFDVRFNRGIQDAFVVKFAQPTP